MENDDLLTSLPAHCNFSSFVDSFHQTCKASIKRKFIVTLFAQRYFQNKAKTGLEFFSCVILLQIFSSYATITSHSYLNFYMQGCFLCSSHHIILSNVTDTISFIILGFHTGSHLSYCYIVPFFSFSIFHFQEKYIACHKTP